MNNMSSGNGSVSFPMSHYFVNAFIFLVNTNCNFTILSFVSKLSFCYSNIPAIETKGFFDAFIVNAVC